MISTKIFTKLKPARVCCCRMLSIRNFCDNSDEKSKNTANESKKLGDFSKKYEVFQEKDSEVILDIYEERLKYSNMLENEEIEEEDSFEGLNLERGKSGVFDIEDLVEVLKVENGEDIFVASVPKEYKYVDYICLVNGKSQKHMQAIAQFVRKVYKQKRHDSDIVPRLEGQGSKEWLAIDLGNIALHIFSKSARKKYDLDMLWAVGQQFDSEYNKQNPIAEMLEKHTIYLSDLQPAR